MIYRFDDPRCLNGWWDIQPDGTPAAEKKPPREGWRKGQYLVPSFYNKPQDAIRLPGEPFYQDRAYGSGRNPDAVKDAGADNLLDAYGYPAEWSGWKNVWVGRDLELTVKPGKRYWLVAEAAGPKATLFVNGKSAGAVFRDYTLPCEVDITELLTGGVNRIDFLLEDYERDADGNCLWPSGNWIPSSMRGLWQDVYLIEKNKVFFSDLTVVTSVREKKLTLSYEVTNAGETEAAVLIESLVEPFTRGSPGDTGQGERPVSIPAAELIVPAHGVTTSTVSVIWENPRLWDTFTPNLYWLRSAIKAENQIADKVVDRIADRVTERFGFRELWIEGPDLMLNGHPLRLFADWGHKTTPFNHTAGWVAKWFGMIRDFNMNNSRLHTHPHPRFIMDMADEYGIYITAEAALHGAGGSQAAASPAYWENARSHVTRFVRRDKNHPSVVLWSCENEMRWNSNGPEDTKRELPAIRALFNRLDPTRPAYHEGDSSLWNEKHQALISRHYGKECSGLGWWDKKQPLHSGEMCFYHYAGPNNTLSLGGDRVWGTYEAVHTAATLDLLYVVEDARANGVCCLGPWNVSCLSNLRRHEGKKFFYEDYTVPGVKPLQVRAGSSEFSYWGQGPGYESQPGTEKCKDAFRPFAVMDLSRRKSFYTGRPFERHFYLVNDSCVDRDGVLEVSLVQAGKEAAHAEKRIPCGRGRIAELDMSLAGPLKPGECHYVVRYTEAGKVLDTWTRSLIFAEAATLSLSSKLYVLGPGYLRKPLADMGARPEYLSGPGALDAVPAPGSILLVEKNTVVPGSDLPEKIKRFLRAGGRVVLMEQQTSLFTGVRIENKPVQTAFIRGYGDPALKGLSEEELSFWSDAPYSLMSADNYVALRMYEKDDGSGMSFLLDSGEGNFGSGTLGHTPLFKTREGAGVLYANQMEITAALDRIPAAQKILVNLLEAADGGEQGPAPVLLNAAGDNPDALAQVLPRVKEGANALIFNLGKEAAAIIGGVTGVSLNLLEEPEGTWNGVRTVDDAVLAGVSNEDLCGIEVFAYAPATAVNRRIAPLVIDGETTPGLTALVKTVPESAMVPLYIYGGRSEMLRAYTLTNYCYGEKQQSYVLVGSLSYGAGRLFLSTLAMPKGEAPRLGRLENLMIQNLSGKPVREYLLSQGITVEDQSRSRGYPESVYCWKGEPGEKLLSAMLEASVYQTERMNAKPILAMGGFSILPGTGGCFVPDTGQAVLYYTIQSDTARKNLSSNLGIPDPTAQTFLDISGNGTVKAWLNGRALGELRGGGVFPDLELERGFNHILILWEPTTPRDGIGMRWRNIMRQAETQLVFDPR
ncbi:MAG: hypothetical protein LBF95_06910 [Treponema sp.]|jgi:hypothetical protein|nr:hypothetical protein [Treponema sp.]